MTLFLLTFPLALCGPGRPYYNCMLADIIITVQNGFMTESNHSGKFSEVPSFAHEFCTRNNVGKFDRLALFWFMMRFFYPHYHYPKKKGDPENRL